MATDERFEDMTPEELAAWVKRVDAEWRQVPEALAELTRRGRSYGDLAEMLGWHKSTVQRRVVRWLARR